MDTRHLLERIHLDWTAARPDADPTPMRRLILLSRTARLASEGIEQVFNKCGLNMALSDLLFTLYRSAPPEGLTPTELTTLAAVTPSSITNRVDRMVGEGMVQRLMDSNDARARRIHLTSSGRACVEEMLPQHLSNELDMLSGLNEAEQQELERLLLKLVTHLESRQKGRMGGEKSQRLSG